MKNIFDKKNKIRNSKNPKYLSVIINATSHLYDVYDVEATIEMISHMIDRILPIAIEWQAHPPEMKYTIIFMDAVHFHIIKPLKSMYMLAIGTRLSDQKEVLGMGIDGNKSAKYRLGVLNEIKNGDVEDITIVSVDGLTEFADAIHMGLWTDSGAALHILWRRRYRIA